MPRRRLLAMTIAFFAAVSIMAPLSFFAGLERGRGAMDVSAADLSQNGTVPEFGVDARNHRSGPIKHTRAPAAAAPRTAQALSENVVASIADYADPRESAPLDLAMALEALAPVRQDQNGGAATGGNSPGFSGIGGIPGAITPLVGPGSNGAGPPAVPPPGGSTPDPIDDPVDDPATPGDPETDPPESEDPETPVFEPPPTDTPETTPPGLAVPIPGALPLFFGGLAVFLGMSRRKKAAAKNTPSL